MVDFVVGDHGTRRRRKKKSGTEDGEEKMTRRIFAGTFAGEVAARREQSLIAVVTGFGGVEPVDAVVVVPVVVGKRENARKGGEEEQSFQSFLLIWRWIRRLWPDVFASRLRHLTCFCIYNI